MSTEALQIQTVRRASYARSIAAIEIFVVTVVPVILLEVGLIVSQYRIVTFASFFSIALMSIFMHRLSLKELGLRLDTLRQSALLFGGQAILLCALTILGVCLLGAQGLIKPSVASVLSPLEYVLISVPVQQLIYYGWLHPRLIRVIHSHTARAIVMGLLFALMHVPWKNPSLTLVTALLGILWAVLYNRAPNLIASTLSHGAIGGVALVALKLAMS